MLSVIMPTLNAERHLPASLSALFPAAVSGLVKELIVVDGGSNDRTIAVVEQAGARIISCKPGRGLQLKTGAETARSDWLLFLHADTALAGGWIEEVENFVRGTGSDKVGVFRFQLDDKRYRARLLEFLVRLRCRLLALPYGDQGLLISRQMYDEIGGYKPIALMEDVDLVKRIGRQRLHYFKAAAVTSAERYQKDGYMSRMGRNVRCLAMWFSGVAPEKILEKYR